MTSFKKSLFILLLSAALISWGNKGVEIYVSPDGDDGASGEYSNPIASLQRAAELARTRAGEVPVTIFLFGGNYRLTEPLKLGTGDGGTAEAPVHWKAMPGENPIISGGIPVGEWKQEADGNWSAPLPTDFHGAFRSFYVNNKRAVRARFPDYDYLRIEKAGKDNRTNFFFKADDFPEVNEVEKLELVLLHDWSITRIGVKSINWKRNHLIAADTIGAKLPFFTLTHWEKNPRYYLENAREYCDHPGEWFCDFEERKIYYRPLANEKISETEGVIPVSPGLISISGHKEKHVGFISFTGITFEHTAWQLPGKGYCGVQACMFDDRQDNHTGWHQLPAAIELDLAEKCGFYDCTIRHTGGSGIWMRQNCSDCEISESHIYDIAGNGVGIGEGRDRLINGIPWWKAAPEQVSINNKVSHSLIEDCGKQFYGAVGIWGGLVSNTLIDHNEIRNLPYTGISMGWMWNPSPTPCRENNIHANHIHHVMNILSDGGGIYCLGLQPDSRITDNLIHDVTINTGRAESNGMFLDEGITDLVVENNVVYNIARSPLRFHKAFHNMVRNNLFVCGDDIPPIRYNNTKEEDIKKADNIVLQQSSETDMEKLKAIVAVFNSNQIFGLQKRLQVNEWITSWSLLGPLPLEEGSSEAHHLRGFETDFLSEQNTTTKWFEYTSRDSIINLDNAISKKSFIAAYAYKEIYADEAETYIFALGTNDGGRLWINGVEVWDYPGGRGIKPDEDLIPIFLKKGHNQILLKIEERGNNWGFCARIVPFNIETLFRNVEFFEVVSLPNGVSELRFSSSEAVVENLFKSVNLDIYSDEKEPELVWSGEWTKSKRMKLETGNRSFKPYILKINARSQDGKEWNKEILFKSGERINYTLFENSKTNYRIVVGRDASESEQWAASELQKCLMEISDAKFEIVSDESKLTENEIVVGYNKHSQQLLGKDFNPPDSLDESFTYKNINSNIVLIGGKQRGTMYAVFSFLEDIFGVRWYTPSVTTVPRRKDFVFTYFNHYEEPSIQVRNDFYYEAFDPAWAAHNKINGAMGFREQHGDIEGYWSVHTFYKFMPPVEFYDEHPEYYSLIDGKRVHERAQLCLTNPDVLDIVTERLKQTMRENPSNLIYSVSQNDWRNPCQCNHCQAIVDNEGSQSGIMVWFVNQVAERIKEEFPDKYVGTLAYQYTRNAPQKIKPKKNVVIRLCSIECCFAHDFNSCPENQEFLTDLQDWSAISPHLYIWDYVVNFSHYIMPYPNFNVLQSNIKTFRDNNSIGIMEQAAYQSRGGEFAELRAYLLSKLLWNADGPIDEVIDDFMFGYYGRSGQYVKEYLDLLHAQIRPDTHIHLGLKPDDLIFSDDFIIEADNIFDKAESVADNSELKERVEMARLPIMYLKCRRDPVTSKYDGTYEQFNKIVEREGITHFAESGKPHIEDFHYQIKSAD